MDGEMDYEIGWIKPDLDLLRRLREHQCWLASRGQAGQRFVAEEKERFAALDLQGVDLRQAVLATATFQSCDCRWMQLDDADLTMSTWFDSDLRAATLAGADVRGAAIVDSQVSRAQFEDEQIRGIDLQDAIWTNDGMKAEEPKNASEPLSLDII